MARRALRMKQHYWIAVALAAPLVMGGCSANTTSAATARGSRKEPAVSAIPGEQASRRADAAVAAWKAATVAYYSAAWDDDVGDPALMALMAPPLLNDAERSIARLADLHVVSTGTYSLGDPRVTRMDGDTASVASCMYNGQIARLPDGHPVAGPLGTAEHAEVAAGLVYEEGTWKVATQSFTVVRSCGA